VLLWVLREFALLRQDTYTFIDTWFCHIIALALPVRDIGTSH
jgi:hypothetical protein